MAECGEPSAREAEPADHERDARERAEHDAPGLVDPGVVERVLQEEARAQQDDDDAGVEQSAAADAALQIGPAFVALGPLRRGLAVARVRLGASGGGCAR